MGSAGWINVGVRRLVHCRRRSVSPSFKFSLQIELTLCYCIKHRATFCFHGTNDLVNNPEKVKM